MTAIRGHMVVNMEFFDDSLVENNKTRRLHTGFLTFVNMTSIFLYSKRHMTV